MQTVTKIIVLALALAPWLQQPAAAQTKAPPTKAARVLITAPIDDHSLVRLRGNMRPEAKASNDRGRVPDNLALEHMQLLLKRPAEREAALEGYIEELHRRSSPNFHRWLTTATIAERYGLSPLDLAAVTSWLKQQGFTVNTAYPSTMLIDFTGTAGQVAAAFRTEIHYLEVGGVRHIANMSDPRIPAALAPAVIGIVSLHDFRPHPMYKLRANYTVSSSQHYVVPADLATIYNLKALFNSGTPITGKGQTIAVIEDSDPYMSGKFPDWGTFRGTFGLSSYTGSFTLVNPPPNGPANCTDPGTNSDEIETEIDAEWAGAAAPDATIEIATCANTSTTSGVFIALENVLSAHSPPAIISISFGACEADLGQTANSMISSLYQTAAMAGISIFVSAGDEGAAGCDANQSIATHGIGVNGLASTPYNVAVGGTDFGDTYAGTTGSYWSSSNSSTYGSALSYVPEIPWNNSCASSLLAIRKGYGTTYGTNGYCNKGGPLTTASGSGGPSGCATGAPSTGGVVSGSCAGYAKPTWQSGMRGNPNDAVRDLPDVSLFAANGAWGHYYVVCDSDTGYSCSGPPSAWTGAGGTSFAAPILAGIQALINQRNAGHQGNPNPVYYALAASQSTNGLSCNSTDGNATSSGCVFYDVTLGDMDVNCTSTNCYLPSGSNGVLSTSNSSYAIAYGAGVGWDFATGLGTINAYNLVMYWSGNSADLSLTGGGVVTSNGLLSYAWTVRNNGPAATATGVVITTVLPAGASLVTGTGGSSAGCSQSGQTVTCTVGTGSLGAGATANVTIVISPGALQTVNLTFTATSSGNPDLNPNDGVVATSLSLPTGDGGSDGPLPPWANLMLGLLLTGIAMRRLAPTGSLARRP